MTVLALLVSHGGATWLPTVLDGLSAQTRPVDHVVAVDTGSKDDSVAILSEVLGAGRVHTAPRSTPFGRAVELGLDAAPASEWVWILHDDANPAPEALAELLAAAERHPDVDILGPKLREWPSLKRLVEVGITISGTGRRESGLERGEYDQGQHDEVRRVLAVNTAGMLVRRSVLARLGGFDSNLPVFGNDLDFGWRAAWAGHHTLIVPQAVVFHAEAAHRGVRRTPLTGRHMHYQERRAALFTLLANSRSRALPFQTVRLAFGTFWRVLGFLMVRSVGQALDELAALLSIYVRPGQIAAARRWRRPVVTEPAASVRPLLAPWWLPYRHGLDFLSDLTVAVTQQAQDVAERRRTAKLEAQPVPVRARASEEDELTDESSWLVRFVTDPVAVVMTLVVLTLLVAARAAWGPVSGGGLSPAPDAAADWWRLYGESRHPLLTGSSVVAPAYLLPLALGASLLGGHPALLISVVMVLSAPLALWGAWRFLRVAARLRAVDGASRWLLAWGATVYALVPATSGAWGDGRVGTVVSAAVLPWLGHAALGFGDPEPDRRWRAAWRTGLLLALASAFTPVLWWLAAVLGAVVLVTGAVAAPGPVRQRSVVGPPVVALLVTPVLLLPWVGPLLVAGPRAGLFVEAGRLPSPPVAGLDLILGRLVAPTAPVLVGGGVLVLALLALLPRGPRLLVTLSWIVAASAAIVALALSWWRLPLGVGTAPVGLGALLVVVAGALLTAAVLAGEDLTQRLRGRWGRVLVPLAVVLAASVPVVGLGWFAWGGHDRLTTERVRDVPAYMEESARLGAEHGVLVLTGSVDEGLSYRIRRGDGVTLGEDEIEALTPEDHRFTEDVQRLVTSPDPTAVAALAGEGIEYVVLADPADLRVAATLDQVTGLNQASAPRGSARAWQLEPEPGGAQISSQRSLARTLLLVLQFFLVLVVAVLCGPTRRAEP